MQKDTIKMMVDEFLNDRYKMYQKKSQNGGISYQQELFAEYDDRISESTANDILNAADPELDLEEKLFSWFEEAQGAEEAQLLDDVVNNCFHGDLLEEDKDYVREYLQEVFYFYPPENHYLKQNLCVTIMMDTGDGNVDFCLNSSVYPCWYGGSDHIIDPRASLLWLAKTQGYTKTQLQEVLKRDEVTDQSGFLESCHVELANLSSSMSTVVFLVRMTLAQAIKLNKMIRLQDRNGRNYDTRKNPDCGYLVVGKETEVGLYDCWDGAGSLLDIQLEKDVKIPVRFIWKALPDTGKMSIHSVYGVDDSLWRDTIKEIYVPKALRTLV